MNIGGGLFALLLLCTPATADVLTATLPDGHEIARLEIADGAGWCVAWNHSVKGFEVLDCYLNLGGRMVLDRSHQPDFAAGLGHFLGRGTQVSDGAGGYWIEDLNEAVPGNAYILRPGSPAVDHRLVAEAGTVSLTTLAERQRVRISLQPKADR